MGGKLIIAGGNLQYCNNEIQELLINYAGGKDAKLVIIATASSDPEYSMDYIGQSWNQLGVDSKNIVRLPIFAEKGKRWREPSQGDNEEFLEMIRGATGFWFTGGDQYYIHKAFLRKDGSDTKILSYIKEVVANGGTVGGTSAGAAMMSEIMIASGNNISVLKTPTLYGYEDYDDSNEDIENLRLVKGLGFFKEGIIDQHFDARARILRLIKSVMDDNHNFTMGYGVSEDTGLIYDIDKKEISVAGSGAVYIVNCEDTKNKGTSYENVKLNVIQKGDLYNLETKKIKFRE